MYSRCRIDDVAGKSQKVIEVRTANIWFWPFTVVVLKCNLSGGWHVRRRVRGVYCTATLPTTQSKTELLKKND